MNLLFAHGAGLPSSHAWMEHWAELLDQIGTVTRFDYPYMAAGKKRPDRHPVLLESHRRALHALEGPVLLVGKSMGGRIGCHLALEEPVLGSVCLGFPLVSASGKLRNEVLEAQTRPVFFVQGTRDKLCPLDTLAEVRPRMSVENGLHVVETGDHSLRCKKRYLKAEGRTQEEMDADALAAIKAWVDAVC